MNKLNLRLLITVAAGVFIGLTVWLGIGFRQPAVTAGQYLPALPDSLDFAGEKVPLERWEVRERLDREVLFNSNARANILFLRKLSNRYFPLISQRLRANGVPDDFKYLCVAESNLLSGARSPVGASGYWQFMPGTAPGFGLPVSEAIDYRFDLERSTDAACKYLKQAYAKFGNWTAAAASYNCGQGGYNGQATFQGSYNYYDLHLPEETNRYIFRILAFKFILGNADSLGFTLPANELYDTVPYRTVTVGTAIPNLADWAKSQGSNYKMLRLHNTWIRGRSLPAPRGGAYEIRLPAPPQ